MLCFYSDKRACEGPSVLGNAQHVNFTLMKTFCYGETGANGWQRKCVLCGFANQNCVNNFKICEIIFDDSLQRSEFLFQNNPTRLFDI